MLPDSRHYTVYITDPLAADSLLME